MGTKKLDTWGVLIRRRPQDKKTPYKHMGPLGVGAGKKWRQAYAVVCMQKDGTENVSNFYRTKAEAEAKREHLLSLWIRAPYKCRIVKAKRMESHRERWTREAAEKATAVAEALRLVESKAEAKRKKTKAARKKRAVSKAKKTKLPLFGGLF